MTGKIYSYVLRSASGDYYHTITTKDYKDVYDYMKNEADGEYEAWKAEWDPAWGEFDETHIDYAYYDKQSLSLKPSWEPGEEQMRTLDIVVSDYRHACTKGSDEKAEILKSLLEQLQKL